MNATQNPVDRIAAYRVPVSHWWSDDCLKAGWSEGLTPIFPWAETHPEDVQEEHEAAYKFAEMFRETPNRFAGRVLLRKLTALINRQQLDVEEPFITEGVEVIPSGMIWIVDGVVYSYFLPLDVHNKAGFDGAWARFHFEDNGKIDIDLSEDGFEQATGIDDSQIDFAEMYLNEL